jgi:hypothetical protein
MKLNFALNVHAHLLDKWRSDIKQENCFDLEMDDDPLLYYEDDFVEDEIDHRKNARNRKRFLTNKSQVIDFINEVIDISKKVYSDGDMIDSFRKVQGIGKKRQNIMDNQLQLEEELEANKRNVNGRVNSQHLESSLRCLQNSYKDNLSKLIRPVPIVAPYRIVSDHKNWRASSLRRYILLLDPTINNTNTIKVRRLITDDIYPVFRIASDYIFDIYTIRKPTQGYMDSILLLLNINEPITDINIQPILDLPFEQEVDNDNNNNNNNINNNNSDNEQEEAEEEEEAEVEE